MRYDIQPRAYDGLFNLWRYERSADMAMQWVCVGVYARFGAALAVIRQERGTQQ